MKYLNRWHKMHTTAHRLLLATLIFGALPLAAKRGGDDAAEERAARERDQRIRAQIENKRDARDREERQQAINKYVGAVEANGGQAPKWAQKSEGAQLYNEVNQKFQASMNVAQQNAAAMGAAQGLSPAQIAQMQAQLKADIRAGGTIAPAAANSNINIQNMAMQNKQAAERELAKQQHAAGERSYSPSQTAAQLHNAGEHGYTPGVTPRPAAIDLYRASETASVRAPAPQQTSNLRSLYADTSRYNAMHLAACQAGQTTQGCEKFQVDSYVGLSGSLTHPTPTYEKAYMSASSENFANLNKNAINNQVKGYVTWNGNTSTTPLDAKGPCKGIPNCIVGNDGKAIKIDVKQAAVDAFRAGEHADYTNGNKPAASYATATVQIVDKYGNRQSVPVDLWAKLIKSGQISDATFVNGINQFTDTVSAAQTQQVAGFNNGTATLLFNPSAGKTPFLPVSIPDMINATNQAFGATKGEEATVNTLAAMLSYTNGDMKLHAHSQGTGISSLAIDKYVAQGGNVNQLETIMAAPIRNINSDVQTTYVQDNKLGMDTVNALLNRFGISGTTCSMATRGQHCQMIESNGGGSNQSTVTVTNSTSAHNGANVIAPYEGSGANIVSGNFQTGVALPGLVLAPRATILGVVSGLAPSPYNPVPFASTPATSRPNQAQAIPPMNNRFYHPPYVPTVKVVSNADAQNGAPDYVPAAP